MKLFRIFAIAALAMVSAASAQAGVVLSNLGANGLTPFSGDGKFTNAPGAFYALGFTTGSSPVDVTGVTALLELSSTSGASGVNAAFSIYSSVGGNPGTLVGTASSAGVVTTFTSVVSFDFTSSSVSLSANTKYWAVLTSGYTATESINWYNGNPLVPINPVNSSGFDHSLTDVRQTNNSGATWSQGGILQVGFSLSATPQSQVPEPALTSLLCLGGVALIRRRMKK